MLSVNEITGMFVDGAKTVLADKLTGIYLHGSAAMGCFNPSKSDIDLIAVVKSPMTSEEKRAFIRMLLPINAKAPEKGVEMSIVTEDACSPFVYPTPFELHFSTAHLSRCEADPDAFADSMHGNDKDLAAHFTVIVSRGVSLYGKPVSDVFAPVPHEYYLDSIRYDIENAENDIIENPMYIVLNLCRVLAYVREGSVLSKKEGGEWGAANLPEKYRDIVKDALEAYVSEGVFAPDAREAASFAAYMLPLVRNDA